MDLTKKNHKRFSFKSWIQNAKIKTENFIRSNANALTDWILNKEIAKRILPAKIQNLLEIVKKTKYSLKSLLDNKKLSQKHETAFQKSVSTYQLKILSDMDPLEQLSQLNDRMKYLLDKKLNQFRGIKCNETLQITLERLGGTDGTTIENQFTFTSRPSTFTNM